MASNFNARNAAAYEQSMGRWSRRLAPGFLQFAAVDQADSVLDVGCGTGSLLGVLADAPRPGTLVGIDASDIYAAAASTRFTGDARVRIHQGDAEALPFADGMFDAALSQLVLQFVNQPVAALTEMRRVVKPGGVVAAAVWNSGGGMPHQRMFWDTAAMLDQEAARLRDVTFNRPMTRRGDLSAGFAEAGLTEVKEGAVTIWMDFESFDDYWAPIEAGEGTLGKYVHGLPEPMRLKLAHHLKAAYGAEQKTPLRSFACTAAVCRGRAP